MTDYGALLREIAVPRLVGTPHAARVRDALRRELEARGFGVTGDPVFATWWRLRVVRRAGALLTVACYWMLGSIGAHRIHIPTASVLLLAGILWLIWWGAESEFEEARQEDPTGYTLVGRRGSGPVRVWLTAHHDSKGQRLSMATRLVAVALAVVGVAGLIAGALLGPPARAPVIALLAAGAVGGALLAVCRTRNDSPGAVDNATGVLVVLQIVDALPPESRVGVLLPDAEEWGLSGARELVRTRADLLQDAAVINVDGIDDRGAIQAVVHRSGPLVEATVHALGARRWRWLPVLVDGIVLARRARECMTIMRGDFATIWAVHTRRDTPERLTLAGVRRVAQGVARAIGRA